MLKKKWFLFFLKFSISGALIWFVFRKIEISEATDRIASLTLPTVAILLVLAFLLMINNTIRWRIVLSAIGSHLPFGISLKFILIGLFFGQTLPSSLGGDAVRFFLCYRHGINVNSALNSVLLERVITTSGLILLVVAIQPFLSARIGDTGIGLVFPLLAVAAASAIAVVTFLDRFPERIRHWRLVAGLEKLAQDTKKLFLSPRYGLPALILGATGFAIVAVITFVIARTLNIGIGLLDCLILVPPVMLAATIPISIAGWGVRETAMVYVLGLVGVPEADSLVISILIGILFILVSIPGGLLWLTGERRHSK